MSILLAIETSTAACSVALQYQDEVIARHDIVARQHAHFVLPWIEALMAEAGVALSQLDAIAVGCGPGGFTGIRIGIGVVQGLAFGLDIPVIPISSLQILAQTVSRVLNVDHVLIAQDAKMQEIYWATYFKEAGLMTPVIADLICRPSDITLPEVQTTWTPAGDAWHVYQAILAERTQGLSLQPLSEEMPHAKDLLTLANPRFQQKTGLVAAEAALPTYLRGKEAWRQA